MFLRNLLNINMGERASPIAASRASSNTYNQKEVAKLLVSPRIAPIVPANTAAVFLPNLKKKIWSEIEKNIKKKRIDWSL